MKQALWRPGVAVLLALLLQACAPTKLTTQSQLPPPLLEQLPVRVGIHYSKEFREYVHKETRGEIEYEITLGPAHVTNLDWLLKAMFVELVPVEDPTRVAGHRPPLAFVLEPRFEEYSFLTPKDVAGEAFIVTIRYLLTLYDGSGARVDSFTYTGYGREKARAMGSKEPLAIATQRAMRDAGAKVAVELTDQDSVRLLLKTSRDPLPLLPSVITAPAPAGTAPVSPAPQPAQESVPQSEPSPPAQEPQPEPQAVAEPPPSGAAG